MMAEAKENAFIRANTLKELDEMFENAASPESLRQNERPAEEVDADFIRLRTDYLTRQQEIQQMIDLAEKRKNTSYGSMEWP